MGQSYIEALKDVGDWTNIHGIYEDVRRNVGWIYLKGIEFEEGRCSFVVTVRLRLWTRLFKSIRNRFQSTLQERCDDRRAVGVSGKVVVR